jgi:hypothetical protein
MTASNSIPLPMTMNIPSTLETQSNRPTSSSFMRILVRRVLPLLVVLIVVALVTYMKEFVNVAPPPPPPVAVNNEPPLMWGDRVALWDRENFRYGMEFEKGSKGHYDFWVTNPSDAPTAIELTAKSCQCAEVKIGIVPSEGLAKAVNSVQGLMAIRKMFGTPGFDPSALPMVNSIQGIEWLPMDIKTSRQIPPADSKGSQRYAIIRMAWEAKAVGPLYITADLNYYGRDRKAANVRFEVPISIVNAATVFPQEVTLPDMRNNDSRNMFFTIWSASRSEIPLKLPEVPPDSCFVFGKPQKLTPVDFKQMEEKLHHDHPAQPPTKPKSGWRVPLTVYESYQGNQMDLGPFNRRLVFNAGTEYEAVAVVKGTVRGSISLANRESEDLIKLGDFQNDAIKTHTTYVSNANPESKLEVDSVNPPAMKVELTEESPGTWKMKLAIPANSISGPFSGWIIIRAGGPNPRKVRIPVIGSAYTP